MPSSRDALSIDAACDRYDRRVMGTQCRRNLPGRVPGQTARDTLINDYFTNAAPRRRNRVTLVSRAKWLVARTTDATIGRNMPQTLDAAPATEPLRRSPARGTSSPRSAIPNRPAGARRSQKIAEKIGRTRRPGARSDIPAGVDLPHPVRGARPRLPDPRRAAGAQPARPRADLRRRAEARRLLLPGSGRGGRRRGTCCASAAPGRRRPHRPGARRATCRGPPARTSTRARWRPGPRCWCRTASPTRTCSSARCRCSGR